MQFIKILTLDPTDPFFAERRFFEGKQFVKRSAGFVFRYVEDADDFILALTGISSTNNVKAELARALPLKEGSGFTFEDVYPGEPVRKLYASARLVDLRIQKIHDLLNEIKYHTNDGPETGVAIKVMAELICMQNHLLKINYLFRENRPS